MTWSKRKSGWSPLIYLYRILTLCLSSFWCSLWKMFNQSRQRTDQAREVASILINNSADFTSQPQTPRYNINNMPVSLHDSVRHNEEYLHETLAAGSSRDGRISAVRRFFCLFVTFDLLFTSLLWIICIIVVCKTNDCLVHRH